MSEAQQEIMAQLRAARQTQDQRDELFQLMLGRTTTKAVERILAAGWVKLRTITTAEELDALPNESLILDARNRCREGLTSVAGRNWWRSMGPAQVLLSKDIPLPATVLHEGEANV